MAPICNSHKGYWTLRLPFIWSFLAVCILSLATAPLSAAQEGQPEGITVIREEIGIYLSLVYRLELEANSTLSLVVRSHTNSLNPVLTIETPDGELLAENERHDSEYPLLDTYDALIEDISIPVAGIYTIRVYNGFWSLGTVDLILVEDQRYSLPDVIQAVSEGTLIPAPQRVDTPLRTTGPCTAKGGIIPARLRDAPSLEGNFVQFFTEDDLLGVDGYYSRDDDNDPYGWYLLAEYLWVREDAVILEGDCSNLSQR